MKKIALSILLLSSLSFMGVVNATEVSSNNETISNSATETEFEIAEEFGYTREQFESIMNIPKLESPEDEITFNFSRSVSSQQAVVNEAKRHIGKPYVWGAKGPDSFDCSGLVQYVFKNAVNMSVPAPTTTQERLGKEVSLSALQPGDLVFYGNRGATYHVAIYIGNGQAIDAPRPGETVRTFRMADWYPQFARRILNDNVFKETNIDYTSRIKGQGWTSESRNGTTSGTTGKNIPLEGICVALKGGSTDGGVQYRAHVSEKGWLGWTSNGGIAGGYGERLEAVQIKLTGDISRVYSVEYRTHVQDIGWTSWVKDGSTSGTTGKNKQVEAIQIRLKRK